MPKWKCQMCGYLYDDAKEEKKASELTEADDCPNCHLPIYFQEVKEE